MARPIAMERVSGHRDLSPLWESAEWVAAAGVRVWGCIAACCMCLQLSQENNFGGVLGARGADRPSGWTTTAQRACGACPHQRCARQN